MQGSVHLVKDEALCKLVDLSLPSFYPLLSICMYLSIGNT